MALVTTPLPAADGEVGASRILGESIDYTSPKALPAPLYVLRSVGISILDQPALGAMVDPDAEVLANRGSAAAAFLQGEAGACLFSVMAVSLPICEPNMPRFARLERSSGIPSR